MMSSLLVLRFSSNNSHSSNMFQSLAWFSHLSPRRSLFSGYEPRLFYMVGLSGLEPPTSRLSGVRSNQLSYKPILKSFDFSGDEEIRTLDPLLARQVLSQLSYIPIWSGIHLLSHTVSSAVPSAACVLTVVFGMGTGVSHKRIDTRNMLLSCYPW